MAEWGEKSPGPVNSLHFAFTLGGLLAPPTTAPFLSKPSGGNSTGNGTNGLADMFTSAVHDMRHMWTPYMHEEIYSVTGDDHILTASNLSISINKDMYLFDDAINANNASNTTYTGSRLFIPFSFNSGLGVCTGLLFAAFYLAGWKYETATKSTTNGSSDQETKKRNRNFRILMGIAIFWIYICIMIRDNAIGSYLFYIAVTSTIGMSKTRAAMLCTAGGGSKSLGRFLGTILAFYVRIHYIVFGGVIGVLICVVCLVFFGLESEVAFWCLVCGISVLSGPVYASAMAWADRYTEMEGIMVGVVDMGIGAGSFVALYFGGYLIHYYGPVYVFIMGASGGGMLLVTITILQIICSIKGDRFENVQHTSTSGHQPEDDGVTDTDPLINA